MSTWSIADPHPNPLPAYRERALSAAAIPLCTVALSLLAIVIHAVDSRALQYDRTAINAGEFWRLVTCQWTHWSADHLLWDCSVFAALGMICERRDRRGFIAAIASATLLVPLGVHVFCPTIETFRGLSGIDSALFGLLIADLFRSARRARSTHWQIAAAIGGVLFFAKCGYEHFAGTTLFAATSDRWRVVPLAHAIGFACGIGGAFVMKASSQARPRPFPPACSPLPTLRSRR